MFAVFYGASRVFEGTHAECSQYVRRASYASNVINWWIGELTGAGWMAVE